MLLDCFDFHSVPVLGDPSAEAPRVGQIADLDQELVFACFQWYLHQILVGIGRTRQGVSVNILVVDPELDEVVTSKSDRDGARIWAHQGRPSVGDLVVCFVFG